MLLLYLSDLHLGFDDNYRLFELAEAKMQLINEQRPA